MTGLRLLIAGLLLLLPIIAAATVIDPALDIETSQLFFDRAAHQFIGIANPAAHLLHELATTGGWTLAICLMLGFALECGIRGRLLGLDRKSWLFLLLVVLVGPGLVANELFKDHWGRARPVQITDFGGAALFTPVSVPATQCDDNCSFVAGDASMGFMVHAFAYLWGRRGRRWLVGGLCAGYACGLARVAMGAHFLSDVVFAGLFMMLVAAGIYAIMYGGAALRQRWGGFLSR